MVKKIKFVIFTNSIVVSHQFSICDWEVPAGCKRGPSWPKTNCKSAVKHV